MPPRSSHEHESAEHEGRVLLGDEPNEGAAPRGSHAPPGGFDGMTPTAYDDRADGTFYGHPRGLFVLCATETWERYSYYAMRALLVLYMRDVLLARGEWNGVWGMSTLASAYGAPDDDAPDDVRDKQVLALASRLYGLYTACVYLTPLFGGYLADRFFGAHPLILVGASLMGCGHAALAHRPAFLLGALLIVLGNGCFKPNISTRVGSLYERGDRRRDVAFGIFYCGINLGAALAPLVAGSLHRREGYEAGFLSAAFGMAVCLVTYQGLQWVITDSLRRKGTHRGGLGTRGFRGGAEDDVFDDFEADGAVRSRRGNRGVGGSNPTGRDAKDHTTSVTSPHGGGTHGGSSHTFTEVCAKHKTRLSAMAAVCVLSAGFWCAYEQQGNTTALFADQWVDLSGTPTEFVQSVNPVLILALTPAVTRIWDRQRLIGTEPTQVTKMAIGSMLCSLSYLILAAAASASGVGGAGAEPTKNQMSFGWLFLHLVVLTAGELYLSPVGLSFVTAAAPSELIGLSMGAWFLSSFAGNYLSGELGSLYAYVGAPRFFTIVAGVAGTVGAALFASSKRLTRELDPSALVEDDYERI